MDQSRRAVESYWRSKMIDGVTSDEDKVTPVYKLEELCDLLRSSHISIVKEVSQFILRRLDHKSPIVKQKALRAIKYAVGKSCAEFKREMQKNSVAVRQLIHYKGQPDPLKGDALNKAVRETAQETLSALFSSDDSTAAPTESSLRSRIQGFGNTNYEMPPDDRKSFISEVVDIGSATIRQGLSNLKQSPSMRKSNDTGSGSYRSPNLQRSLTRENDYSDRHEGVGSHAENISSTRFSQNAGTGSWDQEISTGQSKTSNGDPGLTYGQKTREEKLLETIVTSSGVRLQPTRDALHVFLAEASKLDAFSLAHAVEMKLRSPMWQVRMKAVCVLEAVLRKNDGHFSVIASYFSDNKDVVVQCSESPQASLREKATKVLNLLGGEQNGSGTNHFKQSTKIPQPSMIPDLINTGDADDFLGMEDPEKAASEPKVTNAPPAVAPLINDLLGDNFDGCESTNKLNVDDDPFADVSFHTSQDKDRVADLFSEMALDNSGATEAHVAAHKNESEPFDLLNSSSEVIKGKGNSSEYTTNLMDGLPVNGNETTVKEKAMSDERGGKNLGSVSTDTRSPNVALNSEFPSQAAEMNVNPIFPLGAMAYNFPSGVMFNPALASQQMNYSAMGSHFAQQQFLAAMSNFQQLGNLQSNTGIDAPGPVGGNVSPFPDIFNPVIATQPPTSLMNGSTREDTRAFDFISDHLASARETKRTT